VMRHAEKTTDAGLDPPLSATGIERAARLATIFGGPGGGPAIDAIFVTQWQRTAATARPLAVRLGVPVITVPADDLAGLERRIFNEYRGRRVLVIGHSDSVPEIAGRLAGTSGLPPIAADEFSTVYVIAAPRWGRALLWRLTLP
jgi:probable phosphoglycerate mutase